MLRNQDKYFFFGNNIIILNCFRFGMDIFPNKKCQKHNLQAEQMCSKQDCPDISLLLCQQCRPKHQDHQSDLIPINLLNQKVFQLMRKRMSFQTNFDKSCSEMVEELKKFKAFKQQIINNLNIKQRALNDICKKIRKGIPYQKDKQLFKHHFGHVYLAMKSCNPNFQLYRQFRQNLLETLKVCRNAISRVQSQMIQIPMFLTKEYQICSILKQSKSSLCHDIKYFQPDIKQFKKQTIKFHGTGDSDCKIQRINDEQFLTFSRYSQAAKWYNSSQLISPRVLSIGIETDKIAMLGKNAFITNGKGSIVIYDILNQIKIKQYASSNHKNTSTTCLLPIDNSNILNFITGPNQILALKFMQQNQTLKLVKGIENSSRCLAAELIQDQFVTLHLDKTINIFHSQNLSKQMQLQSDHLMKSITKMSENVFVVGGECNFLQLIDNRVNKIINKIKVSHPIHQLRKIYPNSVVTIFREKLKIVDLKMQKEVFSSRLDDNITNLQVLNSSCFVTSGKNLNVWKAI